MGTIHGSGDEKEEVSVEVHQLGKTISVIIKMWDVGKIYGHCGNFDWNPDNEEDQEEWSKMIQDVDGPTVVAFAPIDWSVIAQPSLDGCNKRVKRAAMQACTLGLSSTEEQTDIDECVVDWCDDPEAASKMMKLNLSQTRPRNVRKQRQNRRRSLR